jgi:protein-disulfide isomerase
VALDGAHFKGNSRATVVLLEYSDFQCPYCGRFARDTLPDFERKYVDTGKVLFALRQLPLETIHQFALRAAEFAECAGLQGQFWKMHDLAFADQAHLDVVSLRNRAREAGLDDDALDRCSVGAAGLSVRADMQSAEGLRVTGTPTFFIGIRQPDGRLNVVKRLSGAVSAPVLDAALDKVISTADAGGVAQRK